MSQGLRLSSVFHFSFWIFLLISSQTWANSKEERKADSLYQAGLARLKFEPESAILSFKEARFLYKSLAKKEQEVNSLLGLSEVYIRISDYDVAYSLLTNALNLATEHELVSQRILALSSLGRTCSYLDEIDRGIAYIDDGIELAKIKNKQAELKYLIALKAYIQMYYQNQREDRLFRDILALHEYAVKSRDTMLLVPAANFLAGAYNRIRKNFAGAKMHFEESIRLAEASGDYYRMSLAMNNYAEILIQHGEINQAQEILEQSLAHARRINSKLLKYNCFKWLSKTHELEGNYQQALTEYKAYETLRSEVTNDNLIRKTREIHSLYQLERKAQENLKIKTEKIIAETNARESSRTFRLFTFIFLLFGAFLVVFAIYSRIKLKEGLTQKVLIESQFEQLKDLNQQLLQQKLEMEKASEEVKKATQSKVDFLSIITHELRTPLNAVIGTVQLLQEENPLPQQQKGLEILRFSADNLSSLINDILDFNKIEAGKIELEEKPFSLRHLLENIQNSLRIRAEEKGLEFRLRIDRHLPEAFLGDPLRIGQIFYNLISNALKFTEKGFVEVEIRYVANHAPYNIYASVRDTGIGISKENQQHIFDFFSQADSSIGRRFGGSGLGLTITKNLLALMNSKIQIDSEEGKGATFLFGLHLPPTRATFLEPMPGDSAHLEVEFSQFRILFVEDVAFNRLVAEKFFRRWNLNWDTAGSGKEAIELAMNNSYQLILMDIKLPDADGFDVVKTIRKMKKHKQTPILAMTASGYSDVKDQIEACQMNGYISKPFVVKDLKMAIYTWLKKAKPIDKVA